MSLFDLPKEIRFAIYGLVLTVPQQLYIFQDKGSSVESFCPSKPRRWLSLLSTSRRLRDEAATVMFGTNRFNLVDTTSKEADILQSFLLCIGPENSAKLKHLCISFPVAKMAENEPGKVILCEHSLRIFNLLREGCKQLATLEVFVQRETFKDVTPKDDASLIRQALLQVDTQVKSISCLNLLTVKLYHRISEQAIETMQELGWVVRPGD